MAKKTAKSRSGETATTAALSALLADSYTLYLKTHNFHWNVTGPMFSALHTLFETHYTDLALAVDEIAERIRTLGAFAPGSYTAFSKLTSIKECTEHVKATEMIEQLAVDQAKVVASARKALRAAEKSGDDATVDLCVRRIDVHEKNAWMLSAHLE